jgi:hypothetical protein
MPDSNPAPSERHAIHVGRPPAGTSDRDIDPIDPNIDKKPQET